MIIREVEEDFVIEPILRTQKELFKDTVVRSASEQGYSFVINANFYDLAYFGYIDAAIGNDPISASYTLPIGHVIFQQKLISGSSANVDFYLATQRSNIHFGTDFSQVFLSGQGDTPQSSAVGFGGLGAIILNGLEYGSINRYSEGAPANGISIGEPSSEAKPYLIQRSSSKYTAFSERDNRENNKVGKTCMGISSRGLYVVVQQDGHSGWSLQEIKEYFLSKQCIHAVFFDGSDSSMFYENGNFLAQQGENKDETCIVGIGVKIIH